MKRRFGWTTAAAALLAAALVSVTSAASPHFPPRIDFPPNPNTGGAVGRGGHLRQGAHVLGRGHDERRGPQGRRQNGRELDSRARGGARREGRIRPLRRPLGPPVGRRRWRADRPHRASCARVRRRHRCADQGHPADDGARGSGSSTTSPSRRTPRTSRTRTTRRIRRRTSCSRCRSASTARSARRRRCRSRSSARTASRRRRTARRSRRRRFSTSEYYKIDAETDEVHEDRDHRGRRARLASARRRADPQGEQALHRC